MDRSIDNYLHKKFKKQLSIEPKAQLLHHQQNDKENKNSTRIMEPGEEKTSSSDHHRSSLINDNNTSKSSVPNQSTNNQNHNNLMPVVSAPELSKSSISYCESGNSKPCISNNVASQDEGLRCKSVSFDTTFRQTSETTKISTSSSSNVNEYPSEYPYCNQNQPSDVIKETITPPPQEDGLSREEYDNCKSDNYKNEEAQPTPEKNPSGKYVCHYCNLVCSKPSVLQKHIRAHTNERPYPCTSCGFSFKTRSNLYKHCRSRTHANRVMGVKAQENTGELDLKQNYTDNGTQTQTYSANDEVLEESSSRNKPYKPRFHTSVHQQFDCGSGVDDDKAFSGTDLSHHINEIISKNNSIVNSSDPNLLKRRFSEALMDGANNNEYVQQRFHRSEVSYSPPYNLEPKPDEPLNLTNKNRKRCMSEATEPVMHTSLIKELLLKNLSFSDMQCPYCKMIFQTVTELELHKWRSCKGKPLEAKYTRSSSVNVASILTKNKNAFDSMPQFQNAVFPLNSPGPFLGNTRLVESDKSKSFSFDAVHLPIDSPSEATTPSYILSPLPFKEEKKAHIKLFGGEVQIHDSSGESKSYRIDRKDDKHQSEGNFANFDGNGKLSENRVVKSSLQSGGTVLTNKSSKEEPRVFRDIIRVYENTSVSPNIDMANLGKSHFNYDLKLEQDFPSTLDRSHGRPLLRDSLVNSRVDLLSPSQRYPNISDFSQNAVKLLTPNLKHPMIHISGMLPQSNPIYTSTTSDLNSMASPSLLASPKMKRNLEGKVSTPNISIDSENEAKSPFQSVKRSVIQKAVDHPSPNKIYNPMNLLVNGKVIRYVPGMPGPVVAEGSLDVMYDSNAAAVGRSPHQEHSSLMQPPPVKAPFLENNNSPSKASPVSHKAITPIIIEKLPQQISSKQDILEPKPTVISSKTSPVKVADRQKSPEKSKDLIKPPNIECSSEPKKFIRPNSLALKPTTASLKQHHGLTPTIFNQILISPDTPRVAKKYAQHLFNGNYFSYLGLKSSTKPVYCTLNKTQPSYVPHFKKLSMYSEWRQQDNKVDKLYVSSYDSRQRNQRYTMAGSNMASLPIHSSYKFVVSEVPSKSEKDDENQKSSIIGGFECNEDSPYIRGRGRGRYVCEQCGIRCKKPSMLKKHIRTHSNDRPYTCSHCNFSFKTKGNLTKHMKSKSHTKNYTATSSGSGSSTHLSVSQSSDSDTEDSGMDSSDESMTRQQEHEAAYGLLSLSQKTSVAASSTEILSPSGIIRTGSPASSTDQFMTTEEIAYVSKTNYAKNKILDNLKYKPNKQITENISSAAPDEEKVKEDESVTSYLGKTTTTRPLTYPYTSIFSGHEKLQSPIIVDESKLVREKEKLDHTPSEPKSIKQFHVIQKYAKGSLDREQQPKDYQEKVHRSNNNVNFVQKPVPTLKVNDVVVQDNSVDRKRKIMVLENNYYKPKIHRNDEVMDLSITSSEKRGVAIDSRLTVDRQYPTYEQPRLNEDVYPDARPSVYYSRSPDFSTNEEKKTTEDLNYRNLEMDRDVTSQQSGPMLVLNPSHHETNYSNQDVEMHSNSSSDSRLIEYDNSAMETLADVATKQVKLDKNSLAKSVASEYLKLATQNENIDGGREPSNNFIPSNKDVMNDLIVNAEGNRSCTVCSKSFNKSSQLRLHMNIHFLERRFRCNSCSVSFRTKGHLQKHERSASHSSKLSTSPAQPSSEPRPFKCSDCNIAFRIHGHLAKHLRSKMHIMKLECLVKIPFGLYAELERSNSLLTEINTSDRDQCLESLKTLAKKVFINDPDKLQVLINEVEPGSNVDPDS